MNLIITKWLLVYVCEHKHAFYAIHFLWFTVLSKPLSITSSIHCKRDWWNSGAKHDFSWLHAVKILALGWAKPYFPNFSRLMLACFMLGKLLVSTRVSPVTFPVSDVTCWIWWRTGMMLICGVHLNFLRCEDLPLGCLILQDLDFDYLCKHFLVQFEKKIP